MCGDIRWSVVNLPEATSLKKTPSPSPIASQLEVGGGAHESPPPPHQNADWLGLEQPQLLGLAQRFYHGQKPRFSAALPDAEGLTSSLKTHGFSGHSLCLSH